MENFSCSIFSTIKDGNRIVTATGERKVPFTSGEDIAGFAFRALLHEGRRSGDCLILERSCGLRPGMSNQFSCGISC
jgi:hypothetical protein